MQQRRFRPGDVLDDYCPRERRITDHAIVAMIDDHIKQTRCVVCDAEHEYKDGKVPAQRRKKPQAALFSQVLEGLQGPQPAARLSIHPDAPPDTDVLTSDGPESPSLAAVAAAPDSDEAEDAVFSDPGASPPPVSDVFSDDPPVGRDDRPWRRQLIRAALPRPEGQQPAPTRQMPEFTIRQPTTNRGPRHGRRRGAGGGQPGNGMPGPARFGREGQGQAGPRPHNGRRRRRGKKPQ